MYTFCFLFLFLLKHNVLFNDDHSFSKQNKIKQKNDDHVFIILVMIHSYTPTTKKDEGYFLPHFESNSIYI